MNRTNRNLATMMNIGTIGHVAPNGANLAATITRLSNLEDGVKELPSDNAPDASPTAPDPATENKPEPRLTRQQRRQIERRLKRFATRKGSNGKRPTEREMEVLGWMAQRGK